MDVLKFGGTSVGNAAAITQACAIIAGKAKAGRKPVVVVSAVRGITDKLLCAFEGDKTIFSQLRKFTAR